MKYKCLVLDHDDTVVNSTSTIHYPAFSLALEKLRPEVKISLEEHFLYNFEPGFSVYCNEVLRFTKEEMDFQTKNWLEYVDSHIPKTFTGINELIWEFKNRGGYICIVSHSMKDNIIRDYKANGLPTPDMVFGWELLPEQRKPSPYPLQTIMKELKISSKDMIMVDDLKPGKDMADSCNVDFVGVGWAHSIPTIMNFMKNNCINYCTSVEELRKILFEA
ncbi:HAD family hydrolase [Clostridium sp.]|uniref:HAD family hydrolase n=1 Tax=Clostridium sp. TaxID=1506 RepID=UPI001D7F68B1|nr:HAD hydrolase-like protein [Clostridium sp.]MBS5938658.1 HAD family hydrolase [Clostridium sp.]